MDYSLEAKSKGNIPVGTLCCDDRIKVVEKIGNGYYGEVYKVERIKDGKLFAAKFQKPRMMTNKVDMLVHEADCYYYLMQQSKQMPKVGKQVFKHTTESGETYYILILELYGMNLEEVFQLYGRLDLGNVLHIGKQMLQILQVVHENRLIHRNIKPENFVIGNSEDTRNKIFLIDYGIASKYRHRDGQHVTIRQSQFNYYQQKFASENMWKGFLPSRRDDLEMIVLSLIYLLKETYNIQNVVENKDLSKDEIIERLENMKERSLTQPIDQLCDDIPKQFVSLMEYIRNLSFEEKPDYPKMNSLLEECMKENGVDTQNPDFVWNQVAED